MSIIKIITNDHEFAGWVERSDSYSNNFSFEGANAVQAWYDELSEDGYNQENAIEFDPIAWCCEFSEYDDLSDFNKQRGSDMFESIEALQDETTVIELDSGKLIVQDF